LAKKPNKSTMLQCCNMNVNI